MRVLLRAPPADCLIGSIVFVYGQDLTWVQAVYFMCVTMSTVGYGDFAANPNPESNPNPNPTPTRTPRYGVGDRRCCAGPPPDPIPTPHPSP